MYSDRNQIQFCQNHVAKREFHFMGWSFLTREVLFKQFNLQQNRIFKRNSSKIVSKTHFFALFSQKENYVETYAKIAFSTEF